LKNGVSEQTDPSHLIVTLLQGFYWFDEGLQSYVRARGWPVITRPQSMIMASIEMGVRQPAAIARQLGISRQAIHTTLKSMIELGVVELVPHRDGKRGKVIVLTPDGERMRKDARAAMRLMTDVLKNRLGAADLNRAAEIMSRDWGPPLCFETEAEAATSE
jgi:DNA-binding MarR family transcriptional regulator